MPPHQRFSRRTLLKLLGLSRLPLAGATPSCADHAFEDVPELDGSRLYPGRASLLAGETLTLHVSTSAPQFQIDFYRQGVTLELKFQSSFRTGVQATGAVRPDRPFDFPAHDFELPAALQPGVYIAKLVEAADGVLLASQSASVRSSRAQTLFVVRTPAASAGAILYKLALATYQAYNFTGGGSLYHVAKDHQGNHRFDLRQHPDPEAGRPGGTKVTLLRPGNGTGGDPWHQEGDPYDAASKRNTFEHWDAPFITWLEREGFSVDYCLDLDVHQNANILTPYGLLICAGHDEYWSEEQRRHTEDFVQAGGNIGFFTGNTCWWRVHYVDGDSAMVCDKHADGQDQWYRTRPEDSLTGVSYRNAGSWWQSRRPALGYTVQFPEHWVYADTQVVAGSVIGADPGQPVVGYECDGAPFTRNLDGLAVPSDEASGTPAGFVILGIAELSRAWPTRLGQAATMGMFSVPSGGTVFNAATTDWSKLLERDPIIAQITRNVVTRLSSPSATG